MSKSWTNSNIEGISSSSTLRYFSDMSINWTSKDKWNSSLQWPHDGRDVVSNHQPHACLLSRVLGSDQRKHQSNNGLCAGNSPVTGEFPAKMASNAENVSIWWRRHDFQQPSGRYSTVRFHKVLVFLPTGRLRFAIYDCYQLAYKGFSLLYNIYKLNTLTKRKVLTYTFRKYGFPWHRDSLTPILREHITHWGRVTHICQ